jgi:hypothetical protein
MSNYSAGSGTRPADPHPRLRLVALTAVIAGVVLLAAAAFVLSYAGIHQLALHAGVTPRLARLYPLIFDAMLVVAGAAALALRGAGWWARGYAWFSLLLLLAAVAAGDAVHATHVAVPIQPVRTAAAVTPWVLLLLAFGLWLVMLRHFRRVRAAAAQQERGSDPADEPAAPSQAAAGQAAAGQAAAGQAAAGEATADGTNGGGTNGGGPAARTAVTWASAGGAGAAVRMLPQPRPGLDTLLGPREGEPPAMAARSSPGAPTEEYPAGGEHHDAGHYPDPVSYGEETGYVHPESYQDHGDFPGHDPADHEGQDDGASPAGPGHEDDPAHQGEPASPAETLDAPRAANQEAPAPAPVPAWPGTEPAGPAETTSPPPATASPAPGAPAQAGPAGEAPAQAPASSGPAPSAPGDDPFPETPASAAASTPWLERLRSTPAPPEE